MKGGPKTERSGAADERERAVGGQHGSTAVDQRAVEEYHRSGWWSDESLADHVARHARERPDAVAFAGPLGKLTWAATQNVRAEGFLEWDKFDVTGRGAGVTKPTTEVTVIEPSPEVNWNVNVTWTMSPSAPVVMSPSTISTAARPPSATRSSASRCSFE